MGMVFDIKRVQPRRYTTGKKKINEMEKHSRQHSIWNSRESLIMFTTYVAGIY